MTESKRDDGWVDCAFDQSAAEAADLVADPGDGYRIVVKDFVATMSAAGTLQLLSAANPLSGVMSMAAGVPLVFPDVQCRKSEKFAITSATTASKGHFRYRIV